MKIFETDPRTGEKREYDSNTGRDAEGNYNEFAYRPELSALPSSAQEAPPPGVSISRRPVPWKSIMFGSVVLSVIVFFCFVLDRGNPIQHETPRPPWSKSEATTTVTKETEKGSAISVKQEVDDWSTVPGLLAIIMRSETSHDTKIKAAKTIAANSAAARDYADDIFKCVIVHYNSLAWGYYSPDQDSHVRYLVRCLGDIGPSASSALPEMKKMLKHLQMLANPNSHQALSAGEQKYFEYNVALMGDAIRKISSQR